MGCCGEPADSAAPPQQQTHAHNGTVTTQPGLHPGLQEKQANFQAPTLSAPPPAHATQNGSQGQWGQPLSQVAGVNQFGGYTPGSPPPVNGQTYTGSVFNASTGYSASNEPLTRPDSAYHSHSPVYGSGTPPPMSISPPLPAPPRAVAASPPPEDEGKIIAGGQVQQILNWPGSFETFRKIPTCLLYDEQGRILAWGLEAKNASPMPGTTRCEWFKLFLEPHALRDESAVDPRLPELPPGKRALDLIVDFLSCLWEYAKEQITRDIGAVADLNSADVWLTVPAAWDARGCDIMREAAIAAGLVQSARAGDTAWRERLRIITEPEAAAVHCARLTNLHHLKPSQNFVVVDAGGGTVDLAVYKIIGQMANLEIAEMCARSGANCGSLFLDLRFRELVKALLEEHPAHLDPASLAYFMHSFSETEKLSYAGVVDDQNMFHFTCFNVEDPHDPSVGLIDGQLCIPGNLLRREVFDPVVGEEQFSSRIKVIARPADSDTATLRGAAQYGLARRPLVSSVIAPRSYIMKVKLPADQEDWLKRPAYIRNNDAGVPICENRYATLLLSLRGSQLAGGSGRFEQVAIPRIEGRYSSEGFVAVLYTSDTEKIMRYTDEGETFELCKWTVDLSSLPTFQQNASVPQTGGFYTGERALSLSSLVGLS
ncbi:hypothetical protein DXG03_005609 [Asterophora parasitica]|uniref:Actin-like ATPase domain-containing protein n=1 Tax=Asterophora parasitica TaxID=117018 RepID=A0A9P7GBD7_9AGAR|nr:hypothetical protein DXG03_005609 [Asterophora parasitica]